MDEYEAIRGRRGHLRRPLSVTLFDLFYPLFVTLIMIGILSWLLDVPIDKVLEDSTGFLLRKLLA